MKNTIKNMINNKKIYIILTVVFSIILILNIVYSEEASQQNPDPTFEGGGFDPRVDNWYAIENWELETCREWGGTELATNNAEQPEGILFLSQTTIALQAEREPANDDSTPEPETLPDGTIIYKVAHYIEPLNSNVRFGIKLLKSGTAIEELVLDMTLVNQGDRNAGFNTIISTESYDRAEIAIGPSDTVINKRIRVPISDEDSIGCTTDCGAELVDDEWASWRP